MQHAANSDHWSTLKNIRYIGELENVCYHAESMLPIVIAGGTLKNTEYIGELENIMLPCREHAADCWRYIEKHRVHRRTGEHNVAMLRACRQ